MTYSIVIRSRSNSGVPSDTPEETIKTESEHAILESDVLNATCFVLWRIFAGCYCGSILIWSATGSSYKWLMYLTNWSLLLTSMYLISVFVLTVHFQYFREKLQKLRLYLFIHYVLACSPQFWTTQPQFITMVSTSITNRYPTVTVFVQRYVRIICTVQHICTALSVTVVAAYRPFASNSKKSNSA